ncbi:MAG: ATP-NAD kinase family protein [Candidatus Thermoplasmatota archaeon]|nr:ATP-NAD kinase family protein [Candidatus Thermoplasmatota archaeon]
MKKIGFLVNPIAGMGGRAGLKGTDDVLEKAVALGAKPISPHRASEMLDELSELYKGAGKIPAEFLTCSGKMGAEELAAAGIPYKVVFEAPEKTTAADTISACKRFEEMGVNLIVFTGGDGTARDVFGAVGQRVPIFGVPSGVKMHSGVFGTTPETAAQAIRGFLNSELSVGDAEIMDLDEEAYRRGNWKIKFFGSCISLIEPTFVQTGKMMVEEKSDEISKEDIADHIYEETNLEKETLWILGSGGTLEAIGKRLGIDKTLLGVDAFAGGKQVGKDLGEKELLALLGKYKTAKIVVSPIGAQGFIFGRGNLQISAQVIRRVGLENIVIVATPGKLAATPLLRVDTDDLELDALFSKKGYVLAVIGYRALKLVKIESTNQ